MIDPLLFDFLKKILTMSENGVVTSSTKKISVETGLSQQSVSRYLIMLEEKGYLVRKRVRGGEEIVITEKSVEELNRELNQLVFILNKGKEILVEGTVFSGMGEGSYYMSRRKYVEGVFNYLAFNPFPGTLNLRISNEFSFLSTILPSIDGYYVGPFEEEGRKFGGIKIMKAEVNGEKCGIVVPERTHYNGVLEIISQTKLRDKYGIKDNDKIRVKIFR